MITFYVDIILTADEVISLKNQSLTSCEADIESMQNTTAPSYGVISSSAQLSNIDAFGDLYKAIKTKTVTKNSEVKYYVYDSESSKSELLNTYYVDSISYDMMTKKFSISLNDGLQKYQDDKQYFTIATDITLMQVWEGFKSSANIECDLPQEVIDMFNNTKLPHGYLSENSTWEQLNKFSNLALMHIFKYGDKLKATTELKSTMAMI